MESPSTILVAVSGGSDSMGLLIALNAALSRDATVHRLVACTVDHALRPGSAEEAQAVAARCASLGIPHHTARWSHAGPVAGLQAQARLARYRLLLDTAKAVGADLAVTGHTAEDQAETIAMRAARNPDPTSPGLSGMADAVLFEGRLWIARPFLDVRREAIRMFLGSTGESWIDDPSNGDRRFERVRVRQQARPISDRSATSPVVRALSGQAMARACARHVVIHERLVAEIVFSNDALDDPDWRRLLTILAAALGGKVHCLGRDTSDRLFATLRTRSSAVSTAGRVVFALRGTPGRGGADRLFLYREHRDLTAICVDPGTTRVWDGRFAIENPMSMPIWVQPADLRNKAADEDGRAAPLPAANIAQRLVASGVPRGIAANAARSAPCVSASNGLAGSIDLPQPHPIIAPFDTFLPRFDLMIANSIAERFGRTAYPPCPVAGSA